MSGARPFECNVCHHYKASVFGQRIDGRQVLRCANCGFGVIDEIPADTSDYYHMNYYVGGGQKDGYLDYNFTADHSLLWAKIFVESLAAGGRILDIGCADGHLLTWLPKTFEKHGIEMCASAAAVAEKAGINIIGTDAETSFQGAHWDGQFDIVTAIATFEHVRNLRYVVEGSIRSLKPDGVLLFEVPLLSPTNDNSIWFRSSLEHIYYPTLRGIEHLFNNVLQVPQFGLESTIAGFGSTYIGAAARNRSKLEKCRELLRVMSCESLSDVEPSGAALNLAYHVFHNFEANPDRVLALPTLLERAMTFNLVKRITQIWHGNIANESRIAYDLKNCQSQCEWLNNQNSQHINAIEKLQAALHHKDGPSDE